MSVWKEGPKSLWKEKVLSDRSFVGVWAAGPPSSEFHHDMPKACPLYSPAFFHDMAHFLLTLCKGLFLSPSEPRQLSWPNPSKPLQCTCGVSGPGVRRDYTWSCAVSWSLNTGGFSFHPCSLRVSELHGHMTVHHMCSSACTHRFFWNLGCEYLQKPSLRQVMSMIPGESGRGCLT